MEGTCITKHRTKKPEDAEDWSWEKRLFYGCNIFPGVLDQGTDGLGLCSFTSVTSAGQMELNAAVAKKTGENCMIRLDWKSLVTRFLQLNGLKAEDSKLERQKLEEIIFNDKGPGYNTPEGAAWCFKHMGIRAENHKDRDNIGNLNVSLHDYKRYEKMDAEAVREHVENGRAIKVRILVGAEFNLLEEDEIYAWLPEIDEETEKLVEEPGPHAIVLLGNGNAGPSLCNEQYHPFLNSHGKEYAKGGVGCIFFKALFGPFYLLEMKAESKLSYGGMSQLPPPFRTYVPTPPPPGRPTSPPCPSAFTTLPAHGRFPAPPRPGAPSTQCTARYLPPWHPSRRSCLPGPVRGRCLTPPRGRYSMNVPTPPPHDRPASPPHLAAFTPPPPHGRFPAPRRPDAPSTQRATAPDLPLPARGGWPSPPRGRDTIDKKRW